MMEITDCQKWRLDNERNVGKPTMVLTIISLLEEIKKREIKLNEENLILNNGELEKISNEMMSINM